jgi:hypothetical protein
MDVFLEKMYLTSWVISVPTRGIVIVENFLVAQSDNARRQQAPLLALRALGPGQGKLE